MPDGIWAVVPAAGIGSRFASAGKTPKQYFSIGGKSVLEHSLAVLCANPKIAGVMLALDANDAHWPKISQLNGKPICVCVGGATRAESVRSALEMLLQMGVAAKTLVAVHDAARPCLRAADLAAVISAALNDAVGAVLAVPVRDTVKRCDQQLRVLDTLDRSQIWAAQTPQIFRLGPLAQAIAQFPAATDESQAMENAGLQPKLVAGRASNIKITVHDDLALAAFYLSLATSDTAGMSLAMSDTAEMSLAMSDTAEMSRAISDTAKTGFSQ